MESDQKGVNTISHFCYPVDEQDKGGDKKGFIFFYRVIRFHSRIPLPGW